MVPIICACFKGVVNRDSRDLNVDENGNTENNEFEQNVDQNEDNKNLQFDK